MYLEIISRVPTSANPAAGGRSPTYPGRFRREPDPSHFHPPGRGPVAQVTEAPPSYRRSEGESHAVSAASQDTSSPPEATETRGPNARATTPASTSPSCGPPAKKIMLMDVIRPRRASGVRSCRRVCRRTVLTVSDAPDTASATKDEDEGARAAEDRDGESIDGHGDEDRPPLSSGHTARGQHEPRERGTHRLRRIEEPQPARTDREELVGEDGHEEHGPAEEGREEVEEHRVPDDGCGAEETNPLDHGRESDLHLLARRCPNLHPPEGTDDGEERDRIQDVDRHDTGPGQTRPPSAGPTITAILPHERR